MDGNQYLAYCVVVEQVGRQLQERALRGGGVPAALLSGFGILCEQERLEVSVTVSGGATSLPPIPNLFPELKFSQTGKSCVLRVPSLAPLRAHLVMLYTGHRMSEVMSLEAAAGEARELLWAKVAVTKAERLSEPLEANMSEHACELLRAERAFQVRTEIDSPFVFSDAAGRPLRAELMNAVRQALWLGFCKWQGMEPGTVRPSARHELGHGLLPVLGHSSATMTRYYLPSNHDDGMDAAKVMQHTGRLRAPWGRNGGSGGRS